MRRLIITTFLLAVATLTACVALAGETDIVQVANPSQEYLDWVQEMKASAPDVLLSGEKSLIVTPFYGQFGYYRDDGQFVGVKNLNIKIFQEFHSILPPGEPTEIAQIQTDENGMFWTYLEWDYFSVPGAYSKLVAEFSTSRGAEGVTIRKILNYEPYTWTHSFQPESSGQDWDLGQFTPLIENHFGALHLFNLTGFAMDVFEHEWYGTPFQGTAYYPGHSGHQDTEFSYVVISTEDIWREDIVFHYFGHMIDNHISGYESSDLCNGRCDPQDADCSFCDWCEENSTAGWNEGLALFLAAEITQLLSEEPNSGNIETYDFENLDVCSPGYYGGSQSTPGFTAALLNDIVDPADPDDDHPLFPGYADAMNEDVRDILELLEVTNPSTTMEFLAAYAEQNPQKRYYLWPTAINCGFDADLELPGVATNFWSPRHFINGSTTDPTLEIVWTQAPDDMSGIEGYAIVITGINGMPYGELAVGAVSSYTSPPLAPGTYYFNIRAEDRAGNWSNAYNWYGPFTILDPEAIDLVHMLHPNWDDLSFPSQGNFNSYGSAHVNPVLEGNVSGNHWNLGGQNTGLATTPVPFYGQAFIDAELKSQAFWQSVSGGGQFYAADLGNFTVPGGRHSFRTKLDGTEVIGETDETNNIHGRQYAWTGLPLANGQAYTRSAPPDWMADWSNMAGNRWYNCDGLSFESSGWWNVLAIRPISDDVNYNCRLHPGSAGSIAGFSTSQAYSARPSGMLDAVIVNRNTLGNLPWDVGVINPLGGTDEYTAEFHWSTQMDFGDSLNIAMGPEQQILLQEVYLNETNLGPVTVTLQIPTGVDPVTVNWLDKYFQNGTLLDFSATTQTDNEGRANLHLNISEPGYYCMVIYRDASQQNPRGPRQAMDITLEVQPTPADLTPLAASGWSSPLVPRPANDGTYGTVNPPATLVGNSNGTYLNFALENQGQMTAPQVATQVNVDGVALLNASLGNMAPGAEARINHPAAYSVRGGRHTLSMVIDPQNATEEMAEDNNTFVDQFVWSPLPVANGGGTTRLSPPSLTGGWGQASAMWFNCDGLRMDGATSYWQAAAILPYQAQGNPDVRLHSAFDGVDLGFRTTLTGSNWGPGQSDFVLVNFNATGFAPFDIGVITGTVGDQHNYRAQVVQATYMGNSENGTFGPIPMGSQQIIAMYEWAFTPGSYHITLENVSGAVDWGISLHSQSEPFQSKSMAIDGCSSWMHPAGEDESIEFQVDSSEYRCLTVWKVGQPDLLQSGQYSIHLNSGLSPVDDLPLPSLTRLVGAWPNPFNPTTSVAFELEKNSQAELVIYHVTGARVRTLVSEFSTAGRHEVQWNGKDDSGQQVASGTYLARLVADGKPVGMSKLVLIK